MDTLEANISHRPAHISAEEWAVRVDLAACYRLIAHFGWDDLVLTHNSARVPGTTDQMLINPSGLMFDEITASNLLEGRYLRRSSDRALGIRADQCRRRDPRCDLSRPARRRVRRPHPYRGRHRGRRAGRGAAAALANGRCASTTGSATMITRVSRSTWTSASACNTTSPNIRCWYCAITACWPPAATSPRRFR